MPSMPTYEWVARCSDRLLQQWPHVSATDTDDAALDLWAQEKWRALPPEQAAVEWLRQGIPSV